MTTIKPWIALDWQDSSTFPPEGALLETKIDDANGLRNEAKLIRQGGLFFMEDKSMYVYYCPTHWRLA